MRLPRPRFTVRRLMVAVAVAGISVFGYGEFLKMKRDSDRYRLMAGKFKGHEQAEVKIEQLFRRFARSSAESARTRSKKAADLRRSGRAVQSIDIDPGIFGPSGSLPPPPISEQRPRDPGISEQLAEVEISTALGEAKHANEMLEFADKSSRRLQHFARLRQKYERAARSPWLPVEPDPPWPK